MALFRVDLGVTLPLPYLCSSGLSRQARGAPVHWLDSSWHIPGGVRQQPHQWDPDSDRISGPEPLVGSLWLCGNCGVHSDSPLAEPRQVSEPSYASSLSFWATSWAAAMGSPNKATPSQVKKKKKKTFIPRNSLFVLSSEARGSRIVFYSSPLNKGPVWVLPAVYGSQNSSITRKEPTEVSFSDTIIYCNFKQNAPEFLKRQWLNSPLMSCVHHQFNMVVSFHGPCTSQLSFWADGKPHIPGLVPHCFCCKETWFWARHAIQR